MSDSNSNGVQVQSGGSFDVDFAVTAPGEKVVLDGTKERQGDFVFTAQSVGEYSFCFNNEMSTFAEKMVDFEIAVRQPAEKSITRSLTRPRANDKRHLANWVGTGRERAARPTPLPPGRQPRADHQPRGIDLQAVRTTLDHLSEPEVLPHT